MRLWDGALYFNTATKHLSFPFPFFLLLSSFLSFHSFPPPLPGPQQQARTAITQKTAHCSRKYGFCTRNQPTDPRSRQYRLTGEETAISMTTRLHQFFLYTIIYISGHCARTPLTTITRTRIAEVAGAFSWFMGSKARLQRYMYY